MWRALRPELVRSNPVPLSPDANLLVTHDAPDWRQQTDDVREATRRLVQEVRVVKAIRKTLRVTCFSCLLRTVDALRLQEGKRDHQHQHLMSG